MIYPYPGIYPDYYQVLDCARDASSTTIRSQYHAQALRFHPDKAVHADEAIKADNEEAFKLCQSVYEILTNEREKKHYDQWLRQQYMISFLDTTVLKKSAGTSIETIIDFLKRKGFPDAMRDAGLPIDGVIFTYQDSEFQVLPEVDAFDPKESAAGDNSRHGDTGTHCQPQDRPRAQPQARPQYPNSSTQNPTANAVPETDTASKTTESKPVYDNNTETLPTDGITDALVSENQPKPTTKLEHKSNTKCMAIAHPSRSLWRQHCLAFLLCVLLACLIIDRHPGMLVPQPTHYDVLNIPVSASVAEVKQAYRQAIKLNHPDKAPAREKSNQEAEKMTIRITEAYDVLSSQRRCVYDLQTMRTGYPGCHRCREKYADVIAEQAREEMKQREYLRRQDGDRWGDLHRRRIRAFVRDVEGRVRDFAKFESDRGVGKIEELNLHKRVQTALTTSAAAAESIHVGVTKRLVRVMEEYYWMCHEDATMRLLVFVAGQYLGLGDPCA